MTNEDIIDIRRRAFADAAAVADDMLQAEAERQKLMTAMGCGSEISDAVSETLKEVARRIRARGPAPVKAVSERGCA